MENKSIIVFSFLLMLSVILYSILRTSGVMQDEVCQDGAAKLTIEREMKMIKRKIEVCQEKANKSNVEWIEHYRTSLPDCEKKVEYYKGEIEALQKRNNSEQ